MPGGGGRMQGERKEGLINFGGSIEFQETRGGNRRSCA